MELNEEIREVFKKEISDMGVVLVDFKADWCKPCKMLAPTLDRLKREFDDRATIMTIDIDDSPEISRAFGVKTIPTMLLFKDGKLLGVLQRTRTQSGLTDAIEAALAGELAPNEGSLDGNRVFQRGNSLE